MNPKERTGETEEDGENLLTRIAVEMATEVPVTGVLEEKEEIDVDFLSNIFSYQSLPHLRGFFRVSFFRIKGFRSQARTF